MLFKLSISIFKNVKIIAIKIAVAQIFNSITVYFNTFLLENENVNVFIKSINIFINYRFVFLVIKNDETINLLRLKFNNCKMKMFKIKLLYNHYFAENYKLINLKNLFTTKFGLFDYLI